MNKIVNLTCACALLANHSLAHQQQEQTKQIEKLDHCYALALNGGGSKGAYQAGVIWGLMNYGDPADFEWDVVTGISGGAINTGALMFWDKKDGLEMSHWLSQTWADLRNPDVWKLWDDSSIKGDFVDEVSLLNDQPLVDYLGSIFDQFPEGLKRDAMVGTVDMNTGDYVKQFMYDKPRDLLNRYIVTSASLPGLFIPQLLDGSVFTDGGTAMGLDAVTAIEMCQKYVDSDDQITLDIILLDRFEVPPSEADVQKTASNYLRMHQVNQYYKAMRNVVNAMESHPQVDFRYIFEPSGHYAHLWNLLNFAYDNTWPMQENGREDAKTALEEGPKKSIEKFMERARHVLNEKEVEL